MAEYIKNPTPLAFVVEEALARDQPEEGVSLADVWEDPLARVFWLGVKGRFLCSQYFRTFCLDNAKGFRTDPPDSPLDIRRQMAWDGGLAGLGFPPIEFCQELYPYVMWQLHKEGIVDGDAEGCELTFIEEPQEARNG